MRWGTPEDPQKDGSSFVSFGFQLKDSKEGQREAGISSGLVAVLDSGLRKVEIN